MDNFILQKTINVNEIFSGYYLNSKAIYMYCFGSIPCIRFVKETNGEMAYGALKEKFASLIASVHHYRELKRSEKKVYFDDTVVVLNNGCILEFGNTYCEILYQHTNIAFVDELVLFLKAFREKQRRKPLEINLIVRNGQGLYLKSMEIKRTNLDLDLFYEDDFKSVHEVISKRLSAKNDKGIVLLHGLAGAGKTTYLRYLVGKIKKRVLFLSPNIASHIADPEFIDLLIDNPNSVVIIEDAENVIMDRRTHANSSVSNLLNISDGLLADFLNVQLICTFNHSLTMVDNALLRKGRLIARYQFGKLGVEKAQRLSNHLGFDTAVRQPMTIAEIANQHEKEYKSDRVEVIGFRRSLLEN